MTKTVLKVQIKEGYVRSNFRFFRGILSFSAMFAVGIAADSQAMQWFAFIAIMLGAFGYAVVKTEETMTIPEARKALDRLEAREQ